MEANMLAPHHNDNDMDRKDLSALIERSLGEALETNRSMAMRQMEVLGMQADETQALLQSGNLTDAQFDRVMKESENIRQAMSEKTMGLNRSNFELVVGTCAVLLVGDLLLGLRAAYGRAF